MDALRLLTQFPNIYLKRCKEMEEKIYIFVDLRDQRGENRFNCNNEYKKYSRGWVFIFRARDSRALYNDIYIYI